MLSLVDKDQFKANTLSKQLKLMKKANPPPKLEEHKIFEGVSKPKSKSSSQKPKSKKKKSQFRKKKVKKSKK